MSLSERLNRPAPPPSQVARARSFTPSASLERGVAEIVVAEVPPDEAAWRAAITEKTGLPIPDGIAVELAEVRYWGDPGTPMVYCKFRLAPRRGVTQADLDALVRAARRKARAAPPPDAEGACYVVALGDTQIGKPDGDGTDGTVARFMDRLEQSAARLKRLRRTTPVGSIALAWLGDCVEGSVSSGGRVMGRQDRTLTEQVRITRRLMLEQVKAFAAFGLPTTLASVPGNHDQTTRFVLTRDDDSWAVDAASAVWDALQLAGGYDHVRVVLPGRDEDVVTLDLAGTVATFGHGHQMGRSGDGPLRWWAGQSHGMRQAGESTLLMTGHFHHLRVVEDGPKTWVQVPAMDGGSTWFANRTGLAARPGLVTLLASGGRWSGLEVL
ncbi:MAG: hypothetical protein MUF56_05055 [Solirubrobacteraceae bacterium]|nr:hypothetical protein [Vicinamibacterales bacterium]MCU0258376.1 hypothetical protein [Solirubrobacteraceae bacterium]